MNAAEFQTTAENLIRTIEDPAELKLKLYELVETRFPVMVFADGEEIPMHEFERRFKRAVCAGNETRFAQWPVRILRGTDGELLLALGTGADGSEE